MARKKQDDGTPTTLPEVEAAITAASKRLQAAETAIALDENDTAAYREQDATLEVLARLDAKRESLRRIARLREQKAGAEALAAAQAEARKAAAAIPDKIRKNGEDAAALVEHFEAFTAAVERIEARTASVVAAIRDLPGDRRLQELAWRDARTASLAQILRPILLRLRNTKLLEAWIEVPRVPAEPDRQPLKGETHAAARARMDALPKTPEAVYTAVAERVQNRLADLLGPAPERVQGAGVPWHGNTGPARDSFTTLIKSGDSTVADDTKRQAERRRQRVKDSAKPIERNADGEIVAAGEDLT